MYCSTKSWEAKRRTSFQLLLLAFFDVLTRVAFADTALVGLAAPAAGLASLGGPIAYRAEFYAQNDNRPVNYSEYLQLA